MGKILLYSSARKKLKDTTSNSQLELGKITPSQSGCANWHRIALSNAWAKPSFTLLPKKSCVHYINEIKFPIPDLGKADFPNSKWQFQH
jgi:hypothetical protein